jgi:TrmH family RNA methyltransferase
MILSRQNQRLKDIRRLRRSKGDRALLEGPHLVGEAAALGLRLTSVLATPAFLASDEGQRIAGLLADPREILAVDPTLLDELADADSPRGILAVAELPRSGVHSLPPQPGGVYLYADGLQDPGNLGALARVAEAAGVAGLALAPGSVHPNHPRALRGSAGSLLRLPVAVGVESAALARHLAPLSPRWACLAPRGGRDLYRLDERDAALLDGALGPLGCLIVAVGAEGPGLSPTVLALADLPLTLPLAPPVESLNATVAAALVLFEIRRRRRA